MVAGLKLPTLLGVIQEVQNRPNGDVGTVLRVVGTFAPVYDVTEWMTGKISMLKMPS